jgi:hypothetical protein
VNDTDPRDPFSIALFGVLESRTDGRRGFERLLKGTYPGRPDAGKKGIRRLRRGCLPNVGTWRNYVRALQAWGATPEQVANLAALREQQSGVNRLPHTLREVA